MMSTKIANATERRDLHHRLIFDAVKAANSCFDILRYLKSMNLSVKELLHSKAILPLESLRHHKNPKIRMEVNLLFNSWMKTLYSGGRDAATCNKALPLKLKKVDVVTEVCSKMKKKQHLQRSHDIVAKSKKKTEMSIKLKDSFIRESSKDKGMKLYGL